MPVGIFLVVHDEIKGPQIKTYYFKNPVDLPQEFISKLYMSHAGFESTSNIEIKFNRYRSISNFTGSLDRRTKKEGILGILFEENEEYSNVELFFQRYLYYAINNSDNQTMEDIFSNKLQRYLELIKIFNKVQIERIPEIFIINGDTKFLSYSLKIGESQVLNVEMSELFNKIKKNQDTFPYQYKLLKDNGKKKTFLVVKIENPTQDTEKILTTLATYLKEYFDFSLEIITLLLLPSVVGIVQLKRKSIEKHSYGNKSIIQILQDSSNYSNDFNKIITSMIDGDIYLTPLEHLL